MSMVINAGKILRYPWFYDSNLEIEWCDDYAVVAVQDRICLWFKKKS